MAGRPRNLFTLILLIAFGAVIGSLIAELARGSVHFSWLAFSRQFGISTSEPFSVDLGLFSLRLGLMLNLSVSSVLGVLLALGIYRKL